jgi:DNA sulfur modification protein DndD
MILEELSLRNFCLFRGDQVFSLSPGQRKGQHLPIVLFGGINGGGKTTLLDAIQLALYGARAKCSKRANLSYEDFLRASIHHGVDGAPAAVTLSFRYSADGQEHLYYVCRTWRISDGRLREGLRVTQDGLPDQWLTDNWAQLVEDLFPLDISQLFFFDAEKIRNIAEDESSSKALGAAIKSLLGLDIVERLITDSAALQMRLAKRAGTPEHQDQVGAIEQVIREHQVSLVSLNTERATLENKRLRAESAVKEAEEVFAASGGKHWEARQERERRLGEIASLHEIVQGQLASLAAGDLPLLLVSNLLSNIDEQDGKERLGADAGLIEELLEERDRQIIEVVRAARGTYALLVKLEKHLAEDRASRQRTGPVERRLNLSDETRSLLRHLRERGRDGLQEEAGELLGKHTRTTKEREDLERAIAAAPDDGHIGVILERFKKATQVFTLLEEQAKQLDMAIEVKKQQLQDCEAKLDKLWQGRMEKEFAHEDSRRMMELAGRTRETMQLFLTRVTVRKIDRLSELITESFRFLLRKQTLVERIIIDPSTFGITLYDATGHAIAKQRLSEGEKQIFAISVLWGLARASARPLPAVIDTPMARLDAAHRQHLVERYFPNASHQVIIFSTDTEVDRKYYEELQPHIARAYHLNYDERERWTMGQEGYFWK